MSDMTLDRLQAAHDRWCRDRPRIEREIEAKNRERDRQHYEDDRRRDLATTRYDYDNQAWIEYGKYVRCGHPEAMDCGCYGRAHEGEVAK